MRSPRPEVASVNLQNSLITALFGGVAGYVRHRRGRYVATRALTELALAEGPVEQRQALLDLAATDRLMGDDLAARLATLLAGVHLALPDAPPADDELLADAGPVARTVLGMYARADGPVDRAHFVLALDEVFSPIVEARGGAHRGVLIEVARAHYLRTGWDDQRITTELRRTRDVADGAADAGPDQGGDQA
ncbi:hypothetical protein [Actinosynnema sp. NPDC023587]|uniref:hypothetical protein n=1 Tax=Actinosynnema sp. NPDC023587 TaxID=3154695 RepID=UPI0033FB56C0